MSTKAFRISINFLLDWKWYYDDKITLQSSYILLKDSFIFSQIGCPTISYGDFTVTLNPNNAYKARYKYYILGSTSSLNIIVFKASQSRSSKIAFKQIPNL